MRYQVGGDTKMLGHDYKRQLGFNAEGHEEEGENGGEERKENKGGRVGSEGDFVAENECPLTVVFGHRTVFPHLIEEQKKERPILWSLRGFDLRCWYLVWLIPFL